MKAVVQRVTRASVTGAAPDPRDRQSCVGVPLRHPRGRCRPSASLVPPRVPRAGSWAARRPESSLHVPGRPRRAPGLGFSAADAGPARLILSTFVLRASP
ncbi:hypothetical protein P7K49_009278 [Saguinus oedipus]|uniref:Uncharacterized protein n=1 Tax=Saguinus oedipus TaxID=9490 RepID=A0ABQ9VJK5_SAGOE|nr:hypothetical protein P7K49_009278 [Saguinus oedipus]